MSLLLEALKKAELAKQQINRPSDLDIQPTLSLEPRESIITREELPEITQSIEIAPEEVPPPPEMISEVQASPTMNDPFASEPISATAQPVSDLPPMREMTPEPDPTLSPPAGGEVNTGRDAARQLFDVKEVDYNPRRPFYITLAVLGLAAVSYGGYLWWQLQPKTLVNTGAVKSPSKGGESAQAPSPESPPIPPSSGEQSSSNSQQSAQTPQGAPSTPATQSAPSLATTTPNVQPELTTPAAPPTEGPAKAPTFVRGGQSQGATAPPPPANAGVPQPVANPAPPSQRATSRAPRAPRTPITVNPPSTQPDEYLEQAYEAYQKGDLGTARDNYLKVLQRESSNRDALLGLAAIDLRTGNIDTAEARYLKLLELDPRDMLAQSGLISLRGGSGDPVQTESRLKSLIATNPDATHLQFTLGNQYAIQARWREAQDAYFKAYSAEPENPDFAFNLAVALDQLRQTRLAAEFYRRAIALAAKRPAAFDIEKAKTRLTEIER